MAKLIADNIISPLGLDTQANVEAVLAGRSGLRRLGHPWGLPFDVVASLFSEAQEQEFRQADYTRFESLAIASIRKAMAQTDVNLTGQDTLFILSTTKGNIEMLKPEGTVQAEEYPGETARRIARAVGISTAPIVVCNACISGLAALITASRLLRQGLYRYAVVCGADCQGPFIVSGFHCLNALSPDACRPFDMERLGLNLGEAAATMILAAEGDARWTLSRGALRNDAFHISAPARDGEGLRLAIEAIQGTEKPDCISAHGTATMFNDQMESQALVRAGLSDVPVNSLKPYFGHTMGAAGILESIVSLHCAEQHQMPATKGFAELGVSGKIKVSAEPQKTEGQRVMKLLSGFGGCNAAALWTQKMAPTETVDLQYIKKGHIRLTTEALSVDDGERQQRRRGRYPSGTDALSVGDAAVSLTELYKQAVGSYPKFYKMDPLSRLGFIASELLLQTETEPVEGLRGVAFCCHSSSIQSDRAFLKTIADANDYFPSPAHFVYTLPNIVSGEIAIRNGYHGETAFYLLPERDPERIDRLVATAFIDPNINSMIGGWLDYQDDEHYEADLYIYKRIWKNSSTN